MATALIHMDPKQKARLARRAKMRGRSFSQEVRNAVNLYLDFPVDNEQELAALSRAANQSIERSIKRLDETIAYVDRALKSVRRSKRAGHAKHSRLFAASFSSNSALMLFRDRSNRWPTFVRI
jgi:hypothetical protein